MGGGVGWERRRVEEGVCGVPKLLGGREKRRPGTRLERRSETGRFGGGKEVTESSLPDGTTHGVLDSASSVLQENGVTNPFDFLMSYFIAHKLTPSLTNMQINYHENVICKLILP